MFCLEHRLRPVPLLASPDVPALRRRTDLLQRPKQAVRSPPTTRRCRRQRRRPQHPQHARAAYLSDPLLQSLQTAQQRHRASHPLFRPQSQRLYELGLKGTLSLSYLPPPCCPLFFSPLLFSSLISSFSSPSSLCEILTNYHPFARYWRYSHTLARYSRHSHIQQASPNTPSF
jgi:hypothetical protein